MVVRDEVASLINIHNGDVMAVSAKREGIPGEHLAFRESLVTGPVSYSLEFSLSDMDVSDANAIWFTSLDFPVATAASKVAPINAPVSRVRANIVTLTAGSLTLQTMQGFTVN